MTAKITRGLPFADYLKIDSIHFSTLKAIDTSALHYAHAIAHGRRDTSSLLVGRVTHAMILDPEPLDLAIYEGKVRNGKAWDVFAAEHKGKVILRRDELERSAAMRAAVMAHPVARDLFAEGEGEVTIEFSMLGLACRARLDWLRPNGGFVELKTTRAIEPRAFARECAQRTYHAQNAFYAGALEAATGHISEELPRIVAVENVPPHDVAVYRVGYDSLEAGQRKIDEWIKKLDTARRSKRWPGVAAEEQDLRLPEYTLTDGLSDVDLTGLSGEDDET